MKKEYKENKLFHFQLNNPFSLLNFQTADKSFCATLLTLGLCTFAFLHLSLPFSLPFF